MEDRNETLTPRIYVADLAAYNCGFLHGKWIDATQNADEIHAEIQALLKTSPVLFAEEWAIHDYEGFENIRIEEYHYIDEVAAMGKFIKEHGELGARLIACCDDDLARAKEAIENHYCGEYKNVAHYAQELTEETVNIPKNLVYYIDYEKMARDMKLGGDIYTVETGYDEVHIFWNF